MTDENDAVLLIQKKCQGAKTMRFYGDIKSIALAPWYHYIMNETKTIPASGKIKNVLF